MKPNIFCVAGAVCLLWLGIGTAQGQGIIMPRPEIREMPFAVKSVKVSSTVRDAVAETTVEQVFVNHSSVEQEGTYMFPLPDGATVTSFSLAGDGRVMEGKVLPKEEARRIYESIVRSRKDPALLEYLGSRLFRASVFPIPAHGERLLTLRYAEVLKPEGAVRKFTYPLTTGKFSSRLPNSTSVSVKVHTASPLRTVYSPTHDVSVRRTDDRTAVASWESGPAMPDRDFIVYFGTAADDVGLSMLISSGMDRPGHFLLVATPRFVVPKDKVLPKQVVFVLDKTGSMNQNKKIDQAKAALQHCLSSLNVNDRFNVVTFNEGADPLNRGLVPASKANVDKAKAHTAAIEASGGTNIADALKEALAELKPEQGTQKMVVFLTDGLPTVGETNPAKILDLVNKANGKEAGARSGMARIFNFGVGYDVNLPLLDKLAEDNGGEADYVRPEETVESIVSAFADKIASPVLTDVALSVDGVEVTDVFPKRLPDLFRGSQLVMTGRFRGDAPGEVRLTGTALGDKQTFRLAKAFGDNSARSSLVPRIWATRKIGFLLDQIRLEQNKEVIDEIIRLSKEYGILTPYTAYLADERQDRAVTTRVENGAVRYMMSKAIEDEVRAEAVKDLYLLRERKDVSGATETARKLNTQSYNMASRAPASQQFGGYGGGFGGLAASRGAGAADALGKAKRSDLGLDYNSVNQLAGQLAQSSQPIHLQANSTARVQSSADKVFYRRGNTWFDSKYADGAQVIQIKAFSDAHFQLLDRLPSLPRYSGVGSDTVIALGKLGVQIGEKGKDRLTSAELEQLAGR